MIYKRGFATKISWLSAVFVFLGTFYWVLPARAQVSTTASIEGIVTDQTGARTPRASVEVKEEFTGATAKTTTDSKGFYQFPILLPGQYTVTISHPGFRTAQITHRRVAAGETGRVDAVLQVGRQTQTIRVSAVGAELLSTDSTDISGVVPQRLVNDIPTARGNLFDLLALVPGNTPQFSLLGGGLNNGSLSSAALNFGGTVGSTNNASGSFVAGNRDSASNVSVDGINVQDTEYGETTQLQSPASIKELRVQASTMNAEYGYGASSVNIITKNGTNKIHGELYEYLRNSAFDANDFFSNLYGQKLPPYQQNQFGFDIGGPIKHDKLFYFFNYEGLRAQQRTNEQADVVPTSYANGDFSSNPFSTPKQPLAPVPIYNPYQYDPVTGLRQQFPGNIIPLGRPTALCAPRPTCSDPATLAFLKKWVLQPNTTLDGIPIYAGTVRNTITGDQETARVDWIQSPQSRFYVLYTQAPYYGLNGGLAPLEGTSNPHGSKVVSLNWIRVISANVVNHLVAGYVRPTFGIGRNDNAPNVSQQIGIANTSNLPGGPDFEGTGYEMDTSGTCVLESRNDIYQLADDIDLLWRGHNLKLGLSIISKRRYWTNTEDDKGVFTFDGSFSSACAPGEPACEAAAQAGGLGEGGLGWADYLMGTPIQNSIILDAVPYAGHQTYYGIYGQDSWRVMPKLTLNYGLRYEYWLPWLVPQNTVASSNLTNGDPVYALQNPLNYLNPADCLGECAPLTPGVPRQGYRAGTNDFGPRIGLAYVLTPNTVVRAGGGIFYDGNVNNDQLSDIQSGAPPFSLRVLQNILARDTPAPVETIVSNQFKSSELSPEAIPQPNQSPPDTYRFVLPYLATPTVYQWAFDVERRISRTWGLSVRYQGSHTIHEFQYLDENTPALPQGALANLTLQQRERFPAWGPLGTWAPIGYARYNALVASLRNSVPWHGLTLTTNFQWAKNITSSNWGFSDMGNTAYYAPYIWAGTYSIPPPRAFVLGYAYDLPFGRGKQIGNSLSPVLNEIIGGWTLAGITSIESGPWVPIWDLEDTAGIGAFNMPNLTCNPNSVPGGKTRLEWWNPSCVQSAPFGTWGNANLAAFTAPGEDNWDINLQKNFRTGFPKETGRLQIRAEFLNAFNLTQFQAPDAYIYAGEAPQEKGLLYGDRPPRQIQFTLRYLF